MIKQVCNFFSRILLLTPILLLAGCKMTILDPKGVIAADEKSLLITSTLLMLLVVVPVIVLTLAVAWRYRESNKAATYAPNWSHNTVLEIICWGFPCAIIVILSVITWISTHQLDPYRPLANEKNPITIEAIALNWKWLFIYPQSGIATVNYVELPVDRPIDFLITSDAPMNSFQIPQLAGQIYAMAGMQTKLHLMATAQGNFSGLSTNFSGNGFAGMEFKVDVRSENTFKNWVRSVKQSPKRLSYNTYDQLTLSSENNPITYYSSVPGDLYNDVLMKYMMPGMTQLKVNKDA